MTVARALHLLAAVATDAEGLFTGLAGTAQNHELAQKLTGVFKEYEARLRMLGLAPDGTGLTNTERDWVGAIAKRAQNARTLLIPAGEDPSLALDRAYSNGAAVEGYLIKLRRSRFKAFVEQLARSLTIDDATGTPRQGDSEVSETPLPDNAYH